MILAISVGAMALSILWLFRLHIEYILLHITVGVLETILYGGLLFVLYKCQYLVSEQNLYKVVMPLTWGLSLAVNQYCHSFLLRSLCRI